MSIIQRVPWTVQPQVGVELASKWRGRVIALVIGATQYDIAGKRLEAITGVMPTQVLPGGVFLDATSDTGTRAKIDAAPNSADFALVAVVNPGSVTGTNAIGALDVSGGSITRRFQFRTNGTGYEFIRFNTGPTAYTASVASAAAIGVTRTVVATSSGTAVRLYLDTGASGSATISGTPAVWADADSAYAHWFVRLSVTPSTFVDHGNHRTALRAIIAGAVTENEARAIAANPWRELIAPRSIWVPVSAGGVATHDASGALVGPGAVIAGSAAHIAKHATTGALVGPGSTVAGASARTRAHPTSGALTGPGSVVSGAADHTTPGGTHDTAGALVGPGAVIAGSAAHIAKHATSGALTGPGAVIAGDAARVAGAVSHATSGALVGPGSVISGAAASPASAVVNHAGGFRRREGPRKGYIIKGKRYWLTDEELSVEIALMLSEVSRSDIKEVTAGKPKTISKRTWDAIRPLERLEALVPNYDDDDEEALLMLM